ncbi:MAG: tRNA preQ1(34) S-adenosylmethionine ribosyltransferase-isomerase QueA [Alphaproteobacteria bacterium]|nr:tRNA preQ1(34) S-adenosylmethionine ribosyltransferase-isomerase QueA [Alphaproteobacteria bacterium]
MKVDIFDFDLPKELIAVRPAIPRDSSRLLHVYSSGDLKDYNISDVTNLLNAGDLLVFNNTKVIPARIKGTRGAVNIEVTLSLKSSDNSWWVLAKPGKRLKPDNIIKFTENFFAKVIKKNERGEVLLEFNCSGIDLIDALEEYGEIPLPPYIYRANGADEQDKSDYQTVFAKDKGAVAAPTAGLHFTPELLEKFKNKGIKTCFVTLHVGAGTFLPVKVDDTGDHIMHSEYGSIDQETADIINKTKSDGGNIIAVGTTSLRLLESAADSNGIVHPFDSETDIFITPGYKFKIINKLLTNFHLPKSTLFMLVSSLSSTVNMKKAYNYAIKQKYRFYSYGDACLIEASNNNF